ncbi:winged helix-turn-helix transcriptional regulator [Methanocella arvoryzae]|uniref:Transcription regulator (ArsR family) n=1 Tax=Methanocella arvoryzae (strain DSM 22066 / NBRC 105507 / MRE50) TaxID=351160 RepID=Q0W6Y8_METAR|nr:winged helix-turn-helix transcriptional regulator [Methanocella arvoryzae]CAJ35855.1 hypothetical protein RCIX414 [Methanocella arvoryzae MRE50]
MRSMRKPYLFEALLLVLLVVLLGAMYLLIATTPENVTGWSFQGTDRVQYMTVGENDTLYAFRSDGIYAIDRDGDLVWDYHVPPQWKILNTWDRSAAGTAGTPRSGSTIESYPVSDTEAGNLYVLALPNVTAESLKLQYYQNRSPYIALDSAVLSISEKGTLQWELPITLMVPSADVLSIADLNQLVLTRPVAIQASGDRVYVFHDYTETVVDTAGQVLFELTGVAAPASVDEEGHIFIVRAQEPSTPRANDPGYMIPSGIVEGYDQSGQHIWTRDVHENVIPQYLAEDIWQEFNSLPLYKNHTLYVPLDNGIVALDSMGRTLWWKYLPGGPYVMFELMPVDDEGNVYMRSVNPATSSSSYLFVIGPDGWSHYAPSLYVDQYDSLRHTAAKNGIVYNIDRTSFNQVRSLHDLQTLMVTAYDVKNSTSLWHYVLPLQYRTEVLLNSSNVNDIMKGMYASYPAAYSNPAAAGTTGKALKPAGWPEISIYPGNDVVYINFRSTNYEGPIVLNKSRAVFSSGIYALDNDGKLVWDKALSAPVTSATANNSTIYYATGDGRIFGTTVNTVVGGIALLAIGAVLFKFLGFGTVARARNRLDKNDNRNAVLQYIVRNPGCTAVDIGKDMGLNVGTIRYHLLILTINHKIVEHKDDKYLRYFTNSNSYSMAERTIISLMKREPMWRVLSALAEKPGMSNVEISREMNISTGAASRHMTELFQKGIVTKTPMDDRGFAYAIKDEYKEYVLRMIERL